MALEIKKVVINKKSTRIIMDGEEWLTIKDLANKYNLPAKTIGERIRNGADQFSEIVKSNKVKTFTYRNATRTASEWSELLGINPKSFYKSINRNNGDHKKSIASFIDRKKKPKEPVKVKKPSKDIVIPVLDHNEPLAKLYESLVNSGIDGDDLLIEFKRRGQVYIDNKLYE